MATNLYAGVDAQAALARKRAAQTEQSQVQSQRDAMAKRAAQLGGGPGGAFVKQERLVGDESAQRLQQANEGITAAQLGEHSRIGQVLQGQEFARDERLGSQAWQSGEAGLQRGFQTSERLGMQGWQTGERLGTQKWQTGERVGAQQNAYMMMKGQDSLQRRRERIAATNLSRENALNRNELARQFNSEEAMAKWVNKANTILSANNSGLSAEALGGLFEALGINIGDIPGLTSPGSASLASGGPQQVDGQGRPTQTNANGERMVLVRAPGGGGTMMVPESVANSGGYTRV